MKILKLVVIFLLLAGGIFLALNWGKVFGNSDTDDWFVEENLIDIQEKCNEIRAAWAEADGWSETLYQQQSDDINQSKEMKLFTLDGFSTVKNCLIESATNKVYDSFMAALQDKNFSDAKLQNSYQGVKTLKAKEKLSGESRLNKLDQLYALYSNIKNFINSPHTISPHFDKNTASWNSFAAAQKQVLDQASALRGNPLFSEMSHVPGFSAGLDAKTLQGKLNQQKRSFYETLSKQIVAHFSSLDATQDRVNLFAQIYNNFGSQVYPDNYGVSTLADFKIRYKVAESDETY